MARTKKKQRLVLEGDDLTVFIAMCMIVGEPWSENGPTIAVSPEKIEPLFQRAIKAKAGT